MPEDAIAELDELERPNSTVLHLKVSALFQLEDWQAAATICVPMTENEPADPSWWIQAAYARRRSASIEDAEILLRAGLTRHPSHPLMLYNLACYACVQGRNDEARAIFHRAASSSDTARMLAMAAADPDLEGIRPWLLEQVEGNARP